MLLDTLRPSSPAEAAERYKDWLHLNVLEPQAGIVGLINVAIHGAPADRRSRVVGTAMFHHANTGWVGNVGIAGPHESWFDIGGMALPRVGLVVDHLSQRVVAAASLPDDDLSVRVTATPVLPAISVEHHSRLGGGWVAWYAIPRLSVTGHATMAAHTFDLSTANAYYDHNWGRWRWGEDLGWEWGVFLDPFGPTLVMSRITNRSHDKIANDVLKVYSGRDTRTFRESSVEVDYHGWLDERVRRVPGALAALHQDRMKSDLPSMMRIQARAGRDWIDVDFRAQSALQLVTTEPYMPGYGFVHEIAGEFTSAGCIGGSDLRGEGTAVIEYVD